MLVLLFHKNSQHDAKVVAKIGITYLLCQWYEVGRWWWRMGDVLARVVPPHYNTE